MHLLRKQDLSVYYYIKNLFTSTPFVSVVDGYTEGDVVIPSVAVESLDTDAYPLELGNSDRYKVRVWNIDVYALNKTQRDEFSYQIMDAVEHKIPVYNYDEGFPPTVSPTQLGCMITDAIHIQIIKILPELVDKYYYRATVSITAIYNQF
jgi:hypothetical protein